MDFSNLFIELLKLSPFVASLFFFLYTIWNSMQKKDETLTTTMKEHNANMLQIQRDSILAQNNMADATRQNADASRQMATVLGDFKEHVTSEMRNLAAQKPHNGSARRQPAVPLTGAIS